MLIASMTATVSPDVLAQVPLLAGLDRRSLQQLARTMKDRTFRAGEHALDEGKSGVGFFIVLEGSATVSIGDREIRRLGPGDWFGEIALLTNNSVRTATVTAETDVKCVGLTAWSFRSFLAEHPDIAWQVMVTMARRIADSSQTQAAPDRGAGPYAGEPVRTSVCLPPAAQQPTTSVGLAVDRDFPRGRRSGRRLG